MYRSFDHTEAEIIANLLRVEGCPAFAFENGLSRLNWTHVIAFGGARVMVPDGFGEAASRVLADYTRGDYCTESDIDPRCPRCGSANVEENPNYRGWAFVLGAAIGLPLFWCIKWRERCTDCRYRWKAIPPDSYAQLKPAVADLKARRREP